MVLETISKSRGRFLLVFALSETVVFVYSFVQLIHFDSCDGTEQES